MNIDIRKQEKVVESLNAILNNKGIAEIKLEYNGSGYNITVVDIRRKLSASEGMKNE